jgi:hypothetical protein
VSASSTPQRISFSTTPQTRRPTSPSAQTKMLTQLFLAAREETRLARRMNAGGKEVRPLPYVGQLVKLGLNQVAERLNWVCPSIANAYLEAEFSPFTDFEESKSRSDAWTTLSSRLYVRSFNGSDFSAKDLLFSDKPITVYFCWPEAELASLTPLIRLVWESLVTTSSQPMTWLMGSAAMTSC